LQANAIDCRQTLFLQAHKLTGSSPKRWHLALNYGNFYFQIRACCALMSAFDKMLHAKKITGKCFFCWQTLFLQSNAFLQANTFFAGKRFFCRQRFSLKKYLMMRIFQVTYFKEMVT
jgi:hypothetical protein